MLAKLLIALLLVSGSALADDAFDTADQNGVVKNQRTFNLNRFARRPYLAPVPQAPKDSAQQEQKSGLTDNTAKRINRQFVSKRPHVFSRQD
jgi:hypothetical protein